MSSPRNKNGEISLVIDIGSQSVGGALVIAGEVPEIIFSKRIRLPWSKVRNEERVGDMIIQNLDELVRIILKEGATALHLDQRKLENKKIKRVLCVVSSPWCLSKTTVLSHDSEKDLEITSKVMDSILDQDESEETNQQLQNYRLIEKKVVKVKLNGYPTEDFLNRRARKIEISIFDGRIQENFAQKIEKILGHLINTDIIFHSYTFTSLAVLQEIFPKSNHYLMIEITGSKTDLTIMEDNLIKETQSFSRGTDSLLGKISDEYDVTSDIAMSFLKIYYEKRTEENFRNRIEKVIEIEKNTWISDLRKILDDTTETMPPKIFLTIDPDFRSFFEGYLKTALREKNISVIFTGAKALGQFCNSKHNEFDPFLFLNTIFLNKLYNKSQKQG